VVPYSINKMLGVQAIWLAVGTAKMVALGERRTGWEKDIIGPSVTVKFYERVMSVGIGATLSSVKRFDQDRATAK